MRSIKEILASAYITDRELSHYGLTARDLTVLRFHDTREDLRWFMREHEELGTVRALCDGLSPINPAEVLSVARQAFGPCDVLW